jgi:hypothetical protein
LDFIPTGFHVGRFVTATIDTEADRDNTKMLYSSLKTTLDQIDVSALTIFLIASPCHDFHSFLMHALVKHSWDKDQFLKVATEWMTETQIIKDELDEVGELNSVLLREKQELKAKLVEESRAKEGNHFPNSFSFIIGSCPSEL